MSTFKEGDWVQITPTDDKRWLYWNKHHSAMAGNIGVIELIQADEGDNSVVYYRVALLDNNDVAYISEWFLGKHIIKTTKYELERDRHFKQACDELQAWEKKKKEMLDDSLRKAFGKDEKAKAKKTTPLSSSTKESQAQLVGDGWEDTTEEIVLEDILDDSELDDLYHTIYPDGAD